MIVCTTELLFSLLNYSYVKTLQQASIVTKSFSLRSRYVILVNFIPFSKGLKRVICMHCFLKPNCCNTCMYNFIAKWAPNCKISCKHFERLTFLTPCSKCYFFVCEFCSYFLCSISLWKKKIIVKSL